MAEEKKISGYGGGKTDSVVSVDEVLKESEKKKQKFPMKICLSCLIIQNF